MSSLEDLAQQGWVAYEGTTVRCHRPTASITSDGKIALHRATMERAGWAKGERVRLLWHPKHRRIGIVKTTDTGLGTFVLSRTSTVNSGANIAAKPFLEKWVIAHSVTRTMPATVTSGMIVLDLEQAVARSRQERTTADILREKGFA